MEDTDTGVYWDFQDHAEDLKQLLHSQYNVLIQCNDSCFVSLLKMKGSSHEPTRLSLCVGFSTDCYGVKLEVKPILLCLSGLIHRVVSVYKTFTGSLHNLSDKVGLFPDLIHIFHGPAWRSFIIWVFMIRICFQRTRKSTKEKRVAP